MGLFTRKIEESIAVLLGILAELVEATVQNFNSGRRLFMFTQARRLTLTRLLELTDLSVLYTVSTNEDQVANITAGLITTVRPGLVDKLNSLLVADGSLNVTVGNLTFFSSPSIVVIGVTGATDPYVVTDDGMSTTTIIIIALCLSIVILVLCIFEINRSSAVRSCASCCTWCWWYEGCYRSL